MPDVFRDHIFFCKPEDNLTLGVSTPPLEKTLLGTNAPTCGQGYRRSSVIIAEGFVGDGPSSLIRTIRSESTFAPSTACEELSGRKLS